MNTDNGGPAFPCERERGERLKSAPGMTLRDYFAGRCIGALIGKAHGLGSATPLQIEAMAKAAYYIADAMLKERAK